MPLANSRARMPSRMRPSAIRSGGPPVWPMPTCLCRLLTRSRVWGATTPAPVAAARSSRSAAWAESLSGRRYRACCKSALDKLAQSVAPRSVLARNAYLSRWTGLCLFLADGRVELDTNVVERSMRPLGLTRKNALFAGSDGGAAHWAVIASLIETCKLIGVEPRAYLADVISRIVNGHLQSRLDELLPWAYPTTPALKAAA